MRRLLRVLPVMLPLLAAAPSAGAPRPADPRCFEDWWRSRLERIAARPDDPLDLLALRQAIDLATTSRRPGAVFEALDELLGTPGLDPLLAAEIELPLLVDDVRHGRLESAAARRDRLGLVQRFAIAGPFADEARALEAARDPLRATGEPFRVAPAAPGGRLPLAALLYPPGKGHAVALFYVELTRESPLALRWGADDRATLLIDGREVARDDGPRDLAFDQSAFFAKLSRGVHRIAFVIEQNGGPWSLVVRLTAPDGGPLREVSVADDPSPDAWEPRIGDTAAPAPTDGRSLIEALEQLADGGRGRQAARRRRGRSHRSRKQPAVPPWRARAALALELRARSLPTRDDGRPLELIRQAVRERPSDLDVEWAAALVETEPSRRREALERLLSFDDGHPAALRRLAIYALEHGRPREAISLAQRAAAACGKDDPFLSAHVGLARESWGFRGGLLARLLTELETAPRQPLLLERAASLARERGRLALARRLWERKLAEDLLDPAARSQVLDLERLAGDEGAFRATLDRLLAADPLDPGLHARRARHLLAAGSAEGAAEALAAARSLFPDRPDLLMLEGETALARGDTGDAVAAFRKALDKGGPNEGLEQRIAELTGAEQEGVARWRTSLDEALAVERSVPVDGAPPAVVLHETVAWSVEPNGIGSKLFQAWVRVHNAEQAASARVFSLTYSPRLEQPRVIEARALRRDGSIVLAGRSDRPLLPDVQLRMWYDARVLTLAFPRLEDGDLIEIAWVMRTRGPNNPVADGYYGDVQLLGGASPVLGSRLVLDTPESLSLHHELVNLPQPVTPERHVREGRAILELDLPPLPAYPEAGAAPPATERVPYVVVGTVSDWATLGGMYGELVRPQTTLTPDVAETVDGLVRGVTDRRRIIERLYDWVIENTRYVALEFGIHALKPYDVDTVFRRRHGDCKDKATLLVAMLRRAGIRAELVLLRTHDRGRIDTTVPTLAHFNHAIVHVPVDELWLDGTVQHFAAGEVPMGDLGSLALLVDPFGDDPARLTTTPEPRPEDARTLLSERLTIAADGSAAAEIDVVAEGQDAARERYFFRRSTRRQSVLANRLRQLHPDATVESARFRAIGLDERPVRYRFAARIPDFARPDGARLTAPPVAAFEELPFEPPEAGRDVALVLPDPFERTIESVIELSDGLRFVEVPAGGNAASPWGEARLETRREGARLTVKVTVRFAGGTVPVDRLEAYSRFAVEARRLFERRIVLAGEKTP